MRKNRIMYVGDVGQTFSAKHVHACGICDLFQRSGYDVKVVCNGYSSTEETKEILGVEFKYTKQYISKTRFRSVENILEWGYGPKLWQLFKKTAKEYKPDFVVYYGYAIECKLVDYCKRNSIPLIVERADWFDKEDYSTLIEKVLFHPRSTKAILQWDKNADGVIAISSFFHEYYTAKGLRTIQIPPLFSDRIIPFLEKREGDSLLNLVYAGSLGGKKDSILPVIEVVQQINKIQRRIQLSLVGLTAADITATFGITDLEGAGIKCYGRVSHDEALSIVINADFSFLLREDKRYAKAGFSTKFAESMLCGVPVICTQVGGCDTVIKDRWNGILLKDNSKDSIEMVLNQVLAMSSQDILMMKKNAYITGEKLFLSRNYVDQIKTFLENVRIRR